MNASPLTVALLINGLLATGIAASWLQADPVWTPPPGLRPDPSTLAVADAQIRTQAGAVAESSALERPLFAVTRRPAEATPKIAEKAPEGVRTLDELRAVGLIGAASGGVLLVRNEGRVRRVVVGEQIEGWTLVAVEARGARLVRGDEVRELLLQRPGSPISPASARPASSAATPAAAVARPQGALPSSLETRIAERRARREALQERNRAQ